ncbi:hypothetical protein PR001_g5224 [Phytophthora rubi]|uniref:Uncharacterized protein n=1 Tax=Phytophthora rubi TaxID=129364 RepID=A0A6A3NMR8_9STRA|nr:hypothetical protein PR001_g5224 [Phytophthora rubi]
MTLKTGMLVGVVGTEDMGVLIQIRSSSNTCVIKLNNGTLKKNVPLEDVEEARDMSDTKENKSPIRLGGAADSPGKSPGKLASLSVNTKPSTDRLKTLALEVGDAVRARCNGGSRWFPGRILRVNRDGTYDVEYADGDIEKKVAAADVQVASKLDKTPLPRKSSSFDVGDKVKARYKKGTKLFSGEIVRVRSDGTYDIRYDDGDSETRVDKEMIELNSETRARTRDSDEEAPASTKTKSSSGFRVDQSVKARHKGGKKLFPGKIKRVHSDGTYDIRYEDGDEEKRVKAENIEATERDEERQPAKGASSSRSKALTVGKKVKARHKNGKRLYPGKISRVRSDGTYDIDYDDGEIETRVEASQIEVSDNEDDMFADSDDDKKKAASTKKKAAWEVGDRVNAYYGKGQRLFSGKIAKVYMNGTYDIKYDDGDSETRVEAIFIESAESDARDKDKSIKTEESSKPSSKPLTKRSLRVGDAVKAKYKRGTRFFPGKITRARMDGTFDVKYEDGDVEERVEVDFIQRVDDGEDRDEEEEKPKKTKQKPLEVGDIVKAPFQRGVQLFRGKISRVRSDGTYDIVFDNGDKDTHIPRDLIQSDEQDSPVEKPKKMTLKVGDAVKARYKKGKKLFAGTVTRARSDGTYDIKYDDGDVEMCVDIEMIEVPEGKTQDKNDREGSPKPKRSLKVGDKVRARYNKGSKMFSGEITAVHRDGTFDIRYEDGDKEKFVEAKDIEVQDEERESQAPKSSNTNTLKVGDTVEANYKNGVKFFPGRIARAHSDGTYDVTFEDGDSERRVPRSRIKSKADEGSSPKKKMGFAVGDAVKAKYKKGTKFFSGKIARVRSDGTYDVEYDDGDSETRVDASLIIGTESETSKASENSPKVSNKAKHFEVGDAIKARYKKGTNLFPGKITRVRSDGTYDVRYDDGDTEMYVESSFIQGEDKPKSREEADDKKSTGFAVGDKVNARYKGGMKAFPGRIVKVRMDGTYDVEYDDGDTEQRIQSSAIELVPGTKKPEAKASSKNDEIFGDSDSDVNSKKRSEMKGVAIKVGDVVEANFKQKGKFHRGKVVRARSDGTFDIDYDVGASERHVRLDDIKRFGDNQEKSEDSAHGAQKPKTKPTSNAHSSDSDRESSTKKQKNTKKSKKLSSSESSGSDREKRAPLEKGSRVTYRNADDRKSRRVGTVRKVHSDGSYDVKYHDGDTSKRIAGKLLVACSDSEDSEDGLTGKRRRAQEGLIFRRQERVLSNWRRSSKLSKPRMTDNWSKATVLEINGDGTYSIRYSDGVVEEDVPSEALKAGKKDQDSGSDGSSGRRRKRKMRTNGISTESLFLLEQLALTLFEEGILKKKPAVQLLRSDGDSSSSESSSSSSTESGSGSSTPSSRNTIDKVLKRLFDSGSLQTYRQMFKENDVKSSGKISRSRIIALVEEFMTASKPVKGQGNHRNDDDTNSVGHILTEWFATHDDLRIHRHFEFKTLMLAFAYAKSRLGKLRMEQSVATVLEGRFASYHESKRQLELWQQKLGYRLFETLQRHFHEHALSTMIPSRIRVSDLSLIFEQVSRQAAPNKPLDVYLQQHHLFPHQTLLLPEFLCCYYQLYGSEHPSSSRWSGAVELRPIAFVASCLFSNGDVVCKRHGDLVRRLSVGRTQAQVDLILRFREAFESLLSTESDSSNPHEEQLLATSQLAAFAAKVTSDPTRLEPAMTTIRKRSGAVSLVEIFGSCGFIIDEVTSAPTIRNAIDKMKMRVELAEVRRIIGLVRNICVKILRFPNNADYWRIRADSAAFQQKIGRFDGATSLLEAVGFVEHLKTHYELRGARNSEGKRVSTLDKPILDTLREKCVQLDGELSLFDGVESISSILQRISQTREREGEHFSLDECHQVLTNLSSYMENVLKNPKDSRCWRIREANSTFQRQIGYLPFAEELMGSIGFDLVQTSHGNAYTLRGTGMTGGSSKAEKTAQPSTSLSNFAFTSVSSQMEWFLWRRKQEIDGLLEDEMRYLHDIVGHFAHSQNAEGPVMTSKTDTNEAVVKMYPYGTNAIETFNKTSTQRKQLEMMRNVFKTLDVDQKGVLNEADFSRAYGSSSSLPTWARFEAFDIGNDGKVDLTDFVAALGPLLDHPYEVRGDKSGDLVASSSADEVNSTLCEVVSLSVGNLRLETSCASAAVALEGLLTHLFSIIQEPGNPLLWSISDKVPTTSKLLRFSAGRELIRLVGFREAPGVTPRTYELQPQRVRFQTSKTSSEVSASLDSATITRLQTIAAMLAGHYRGLKNPSVSDISAVSRAICASERCSDGWSRVVQLAVKCLQNIESQPDNPRYRELHTATSTFTKLVGSVHGGSELLLSIGFRETDAGTLAIPSDSQLDELKARRLELEVGLALLHLKLAAPGLDQSSCDPPVHRKPVSDKHKPTRAIPSQPKVKPKATTTHHQTHKQNTLKNQNRGRPATAIATVARKTTSHNHRPPSVRAFTDPIETEILSGFPLNEEPKSRVNGMKTFNRGRRKTNTVGQDRALPNRKQSGLTMVLAESASSGADVIVVQKGQFVLRGAYVRVGAEIRDLYEERMVVDVSSNEEHAPGFTKLRLGVPLRFFHPAKELVATILLPSMELVKRLETSDTQTFAREIVRALIKNVVESAPTTTESGDLKGEAEPERSKLVTTLITSFEVMNTLPDLASNLEVGPSMRYLVTWSAPGVSVVSDHLSDRKLMAYWEGLVLQPGTSNKTVRLADVKQICRWNGHLSLLWSTAANESGTREVNSTKSDGFQMTYKNFREFFRLPPSSTNDEEERDGRLELPLAYLRKHFQALALTTELRVDGFQSVQAFDLLHRVYKDVQEHPPVVSVDPQTTQEGLETIQAACQKIEQTFVDRQRSGRISWPQLVYFVRYNKRLTTPDIFPSAKPQIVVKAGDDRKVAEVVSGMHSSRVLILYFDGTVEVWNMTSDNATQNAAAQVFFSTKTKAGEESSKTFIESWMEASQTTESEDTHAKRAAARINQFKRSSGTCGALIRFCGWDSVVCVNSSNLQESGSGSFRFFRMADSFLSPIRQVNVEQLKVDVTRSDNTEKKVGTASSSGVIRTFQVTVDGSKVVFLTGSDTVVWVACAGTGAILCHADLQASQVGKFRVFFQVIDKTLPSGEIQTQLYATTSAKSYRHAGMWVLPEISEEMKKPFERNKVFSFGKSKAATVVGLAVSADLLFIASRDGAIIVWSTATDQISPIAPLICLQIPLHHQELQSIYCQPFGHESIELGTNVIQVGDTAAADIDRWEVDVLQHLDPAPLRFALYLFDDGDTIRLPVPGSFDVRLVTLDDPAFEYDVFLTPVSGVEHNGARRVTLQKQRIIRVLFIALRHSRDDIFAQKSVQTFFQDFENYGVQWKTRDEMKTFASSYQENVRVELQAFYRFGDNEFTELTKPQSSNSNESTKDAHPVLAVGVALKSRVGDQATFQAWKFAMNWCTDEIRSEIDPEDGQLSHTRRVLALQSSYRLEAERMARIRRDFSLEEHVEVMETRHSAMVRGIKDGVRDSIAHNGRPEVVADNLLKAVNVLALASFSARVGVDPLEAFVSRIYRQCTVNIGDEESVELSRANLRLFIKLMQLQEDRNVCFAAWLKQFHQELVSAEKLPVSRSKNSVWSWLSLKLRHIAASTQTTADVGSLLVGLGLADAFNCSRDSKCGSDSGFPSASSLPSLMLQLHRTVNSTRGETLAKLPLESTMETLLTPRTVVEFMVECTNFAAFFHAKMTDLQSQVQGLLDNESHQMAPEASYVLQLQTRRWQQELRELAQSHNQLNCDGFGSEDIGLEATVEDRQHLERLLKTPLPANHPRVSSITLEDRCDTIRSRDRFVMNAIGRLTGAGVEFVSLSVLYVFMGTEEHAEQEFQQELTFLRKVQHLRAREYFLPVFLDILDVPILPAANAMICASDTDEVRCVVTDSLRGWSSLTECIQLMRLSPFPMEYWTPLLWCWSLRVLMALLTMQKERFALRKGLDMDTMLVSPDGCDLRLSSVAGGGFVRFGERGEDANSLEKTFGCFVYALLLYVFSDEGVTADLDVNISLVVEADDEVMLRKMRSQLIRLMASKSVDSTCGDERNRIAALTDFSSITQIVACRAGKREGGELGTLCELSLLALQPSDTRPGLESLWVYAGRPGIAEESPQLKTLSLRMVTIVKLQRPMQKLLRDVRVCWEECDDRVGNVSTLQCAIESWTALLHQIFQLKPNRDDKKDAPTAQIFVHTLTQTLESCVPYQLCAIAMRTFTQCSKRGDREEGRQAIQILLGRFANVLELVETTTNFDELSSNSLLMRTVQQVLECLVSVASGQMPPRHLSADIPSLSSRFQRDTAANAVLWRLSERCFKDLLAIETASSKYPALLQWLSSRRASFGFASALCVDYEGASGAFDTNKPTLNRQLALWWSGHTPRTPRHTLSSAAEDELVKDGCTVEGPITADQLRFVYETKEIEFKLTSGVSVPKFRLAALQQFFGPTFFERKRCFPLVFVRPLVAKVWRDLAFDRLICTLLRDRDEKIVLGALSLLECSTRVFRFDVLRSPRLATSKEAAESTGSLAYSCSEWTFAVSLCSQSVALEVKRVLDRTTRSLKVLGESGTSSASRSQHPLVAILCVGIAWLVNCLYGGDSTTQFWGTVGIDQFLVAHCKANSLPFVKIKDSNMMNQVFHQGQRLPQQDSTKWRVFTSEAAENRSHRSSAGRNCSPFRLLLDEIILVGSNRAVGLMRTLLLSRTFREEAGGLDISSPESAFQRDLLSSGHFGNVSHAIDLARDITQLNGTTNEQIQLVLYTNAVFLLQTATAARFRLSVFAPVCREIWGWMETTWRTIAVHSSSKAGGTDEKAVKLARAQGDVLVAGFSLLHSIVTRPSVTIEDIAELTTFDAGEDAEMVNVLHEIFSWIINMPGGVSRRRGSPVSVVVEGAVKLLTNSVQSRRYDEVALAMVNTCVDTRILLEMLGVDDAVESEEGKTIVSIDEKQQLWAMLLYFDNRTVTSRILDLDFLDSAVFSRLIGLRTTANSDEDELNILNRRLEAALLLEILVLAASRRGKSVNTRMLFAEACKLVLHHDIVAKEARYVRKVHDSSGKSRKRVAASKRVMQLVCCLCVDFSSQSASRVFLEHLESVGIPAWVVAFHQAQHGAVSNEQQLVTRVELFWEDWQGHSAAGTRSVNHNVVLEPSRKTKTEKIVVQTARRLQRSASQATERPPSRVKAVGRVEAEVLDSEVSVKEADSKPELAKPRQTAARTSTATKKEPSVLHTLVSIDADSALRLVRKTSTAPGKRNRKQQRESVEDEEALDSDAYSPFPDGSSTEEEPPRAARKAKTRKNSSQEQKVTTRRESEDKENKFQGDSSQTRGSDDGSSDASSSVSSRERPRRKPQRPKVAANQQLDALRAIFRKYDVDGDGFISFIDLRRAMDKQTAGQGHRLSDLEIQRWITDKDRGGQGVVSFEDFADAFKGQLQK